MSEKLFGRVALIGIGLIGSSLARALRRDSPGTVIVACARRSETLATVRRLELADETTDDPRKNADAVFAFLQRHGILTRKMGAYGLPQYLRITIGTGEEMERVAATLGEIMASR